MEEKFDGLADDVRTVKNDHEQRLRHLEQSDELRKKISDVEKNMVTWDDLKRSRNWVLGILSTVVLVVGGIVALVSALAGG